MIPLVLDDQSIRTTSLDPQQPGLANTVRRALMFASTVVSDGLSLLLALGIAAGIRVLLGRILAPYDLSILREYQFLNTLEFRYALPMMVLILLFYAIRGLYDPISRGPIVELQSISIATSTVFLFLMSLSFVLRTSSQVSRVVISFTWVLALLLLPFGRSVTRSIFSKTKWWGELVAVVDVGSSSTDFVNHLLRHPKLGVRPALIVKLGLKDDGHLKNKRVIFHLHSLGYFPKWISCALFVVEGSPVQSSEVLGEFQDIFSRIILVGIAPGQRLNWSGAIDLAGVPGFEIRHNLLDKRAQITKRLIDIVLSSLALVAFLPISLLTAWLIKMDSGGPVFFRQERVGMGGELFDMWKFRTMHKDAQRLLGKVLEADPGAREEWDEYQKLKDDPRITKVGRLLRRFSLDEIPQFWNVLIGDMSLVGPRPYFPDQSEAYGASQVSYHRVRPGVTGLWQVSERNKATFADRALIDEEYVRKWSIWFDLYILAKTPWIVLGGGRAY